MSHRPWIRLSVAALAATAGATAGFAPPAIGAQYLSAEQAPKALFAEADRFEVRVIRLTPEQSKALDAVAPVRQRGEVRVIDAWAGNRKLGTVYIDDVIGKVEWITYALALSPEGEVSGLEILEYRETHGFEVRTAAWRKQFNGHRPGQPLSLGEDIKNISGATLSCAHLTAGVQRLMVLHAQLAKSNLR